jgi:hypothetical protein
MQTNKLGLPMLWLSLLLAALLAVTACGGLFWPATYARETRTYAAEGVGGDAFNLAVVLPVLIISAVLARRGAMAARLVWMGALVFLVYDFVFYTLAVHFNSLFLVYCAVWGLSFYLLAVSIPALPVAEIATAYGPRAPVTLTAIMFLWIVVSAGGHWLTESVPAVLSGGVPKSVVDQGLLTDPAAVLDLPLLLPGLVITAILLLRRRPLAFVLGPIFLALAILVSLMISAMMVIGNLRGFPLAYAPFLINVASSAACVVLLTLFLRPRT